MELDTETQREIKMIRDHFLCNTDKFLGFEVRPKLIEEKRSVSDNSKWLFVVYERNGIVQYSKASHNNNQKIMLKSNSYFTEEGFKYRGVAK